jgi:hypothetical protein
MPFRLDVGGVVVQDIKDIVALMLMRPDNPTTLTLGIFSTKI